MSDILLAIFMVAFLGLIVALNVSEQRRRAKLTPEQRGAEDRETEREMQLW